MRNNSCRFSVFALLLACLLLSGCFTTSVHPLYNASDPIFDKALLGTWVVADGKDVLILRRGPNNNYVVIYYLDGRAASYKANLVEIAKIRYLDVFPEVNDKTAINEHFVPSHSFWRVSVEGDSLSLTSIDEDWLKAFLQEWPSAIPHAIVQDSIVLTGGTNQLQEFIRAHSDDLFNREKVAIWKRT